MILAEIKVYDHGLSPLPMQNLYSKLFFLWHKLFICNLISKCLLHTL